MIAENSVHNKWNVLLGRQFRRPSNGLVLYRVGEIMEHRRYGYRGVVFGWDPACTAGDEWIAQMNVDALPGQPHDSFCTQA